MFGFKELLNKGVEMINDIQSIQMAKAGPSSASATVRDHPGRNLVARHEQSWNQILANNSKLASVVAKDEAPVRQVAGRCEAELASWGRLQQELEALAGVGDSVDTLRAEMEALCGQLQTLDTSLDQHLEAREDRDMWLWKGELQRDTDMFEGARVREVKMLERQLKAEMAKKARMKAAVSPHAAPLARPQGSARAEQLPEGSHAPAIASVQPEENQKHAATSEGSSAENAQEDCKVSVSAPAVAKGEHGVEKDDEGSKPAPEDTTSNSEGQNQAQEKKEAAEVATRAKESTVEEGKQAVKASKLEGESKAEREEKTDT